MRCTCLCVGMIVLSTRGLRGGDRGGNSSSTREYSFVIIKNVWEWLARFMTTRDSSIRQDGALGGRVCLQHAREKDSLSRECHVNRGCHAAD